ncbi:MAG TPA: efflux RND transporter periplasmic adaptor subunit [Bryobacteraceae bacterium]|nr:efflux RND transporter periplasmic adaptor subunit [Bryobacteraceae bacterium]
MPVDEKPQVVSNEAATGGEPRRTLRPIVFLPVLLIALILGFFIYSGIRARTAAAKTLARDTRAMAIPTVNVISPKIGAPAEEITLPGNTQAFTDTPIYARTNGYIKRWYADIGARVKAGQLLATIETPEIDQQLQQALADLATAQANYELAKSTAARWEFLLKTDSVSKQETDEKIGDLNAKKATVDASQANVRRLEQTQGFQKVYAPFSGVITARNIDTGSLINAGAGSPGSQLFHIAAVDKLRVYVAVPEAYSRAARSGSPADLTLNEFPGRTFHGTLVRTSNSIDPTSRTLLTEVDVNNPTGELLPGSYVFVHLKLPSQVRAFTIPSNTLLFRSEGLQVAVVRNDHAQLIPIKIGRDYGAAVEVISGLRAGEQLIVDPADSLVSGTEVQVVRKGSGGTQE